MKDKNIVLITGGNSGIGIQTALTFAKNGFKVIITARDAKDAKIAIAQIKSLSNNKDVIFVQGSLSTFAECQMLAARIAAEVPLINVLINNAGVTMTKKELNAEGFELSFMVNALAPYVLSKELTRLEVLKAYSKILNVNTGAQVLRMAKFDIAKTPFGNDYSTSLTYAKSKLASAMLSLNLADELRSKKITVNCFSPGLFKTKNSTQKMNNFFLDIIRDLLMMKSMPLEMAGNAPFFLATDEQIKGVTGQFFNLKTLDQFPRNVQDANARNQLAETTAEWMSKYIA
jgi:NAD(P)-dependent dehydrogenase (short-subunit alcohol dehydrogenase family)